MQTSRVFRPVNDYALISYNFEDVPVVYDVSDTLQDFVHRRKLAEVNPKRETAPHADKLVFRSVYEHEVSDIIAYSIREDEGFVEDEYIQYVKTTENPKRFCDWFINRVSKIKTLDDTVIDMMVSLINRNAYSWIPIDIRYLNLDDDGIYTYEIVFANPRVVNTYEIVKFGFQLYPYVQRMPMSAGRYVLIDQLSGKNIILDDPNLARDLTYKLTVGIKNTYKENADKFKETWGNTVVHTDYFECRKRYDDYMETVGKRNAVKNIRKLLSNVENIDTKSEMYSYLMDNSIGKIIQDIGLGDLLFCSARVTSTDFTFDAENGDFICCDVSINVLSKGRSKKERYEKVKEEIRVVAGLALISFIKTPQARKMNLPISMFRVSDMIFTNDWRVVTKISLKKGFEEIVNQTS